MITMAEIKNAYVKFNNKYFSGELKPIEIHFSKTKRALGAFHCQRSFGATKTWICISTYYDRPTKNVMETLLHEMIHQWQFENGMPVDHKENFKDMAFLINLDGWGIKRCNNNNGEVSQDIIDKNKTYDVFAYNAKDKFFMFVASPSKVTYYIDWLTRSPYFNNVIYFKSKDARKYGGMVQCRRCLRGKFIRQDDYLRLIEENNVQVIKKRETA